MVDDGRTWSYRQILEWSDTVTRALSRIGVADTDAVGLMAPNSAAFVAGFFGVARLGAAIAPMSVRYREQELMFFIEDSGAAAVLAGPDLVNVVRSALSRLERPPALVAIDHETCEIVSEGRPAHSIPGRPESALLLQYTSGSTGRPKRVIRTNTHLTTELEHLSARLGTTSSDRFLGVAPFSHVNGLVRSMMHSMFVGATLYPVGEFRRRRVAEILHRDGITHLGAIPQVFVALGQTAIDADAAFPKLRIVFCSSAPLLQSDNRRFGETYGRFVRQLYGSTETGTMSVNMDADLDATLDSVGTPLEGVEFEIRDGAGNPLPVGRAGEIAVSSETAISEYAGNPGATRRAFDGAFYLTGDLGFRDEAGRLYLTGRQKFLINRGGFKVNPLEVERAIASHPGVHEVVVYGEPTQHGDERVRCAIVAKKPCAAEEIVNHCRGLIADYKIPSRIEFREELPKSISGKILRSEL